MNYSLPLALVVLARERLAAYLLTRHTVAVAALATTLVFATVAHLVALDVARELDVTRQRLLRLPALTALFDHLTTLFFT